MPAEAPGQHPNDGDREDAAPEHAEESPDHLTERGEDPEERALIAAVRRGDPDAVAALFRRHRPAAIRFASATSNRNLALVEDIVSEAFERVFAAMHQGGGPEAFRPYLFTTIRRVSVDMHRKHGREVASGGVSEVSTDAPMRALVTEDTVGARLDADIVRRAFLSLPERWRLVLWYTAVESRTMRETADLLGTNPNSAGVLGFRAREGLRNAYLAEHMSAARDGAHREVLELVPRWIRGGLPAAKRELVEQHLETCVSCTAVVEELSAINTHLGASLGPLLLGLGLTGPSLVAGVGTAVHLATRTSLSLWRLALAISASAALVTIGVVAFRPGHDPTPPRPARSPATYPTAVLPGALLRPRPPSPAAVVTPAAPSVSPTAPATSATTAPVRPSAPVASPASPPGIATPAPVDVRVGPAYTEPVADGWTHLRVGVRGRGPALTLTATLRGVSDHLVHQEHEYGRWVCTDDVDPGGDLRLTCRLAAGAVAQDFAIDVLPRGGSTTIWVDARAVAVRDPAPTNNSIRVMLPSP